MPTVLKSGSLNLLEPSGPVQACKGSTVVFNAKITDVVEDYVKQRRFESWLIAEASYMQLVLFPEQKFRLRSRPWLEW